MTYRRKYSEKHSLLCSQFSVSAGASVLFEQGKATVMLLEPVR